MCIPPIHGTFTDTQTRANTEEGYYMGEAQYNAGRQSNHRIVMFNMDGERVEKRPGARANFEASTQGLQTLKEAGANRLKAVQTI